MRIFFLLALLLLTGWHVRPATIPAASASYADVNAALSSASSGDTITIPAGSATWASQLNLNTKRVWLIGAGAGQTVISNNFGNQLIRVTPNSMASVVRISGMTFTSSYGKFYTISIAGPALIRVDHCTFIGGEEIIDTNFDESGTARVVGIVDHILAHNVRIFHRGNDIRPGDSEFGDVAWTEPFEYGGTNQMTFEDGTNTFDANFTQTGDAACFYNHYGAKFTLRYWKFGTNANSGFVQNYVDQHGDEGNNSTMRSEIYMCEFWEGPQGSGGSDQMINQRGGRSINFSNTFHSTKVPYGLIRYDASNTRTHDVTNSYYYGLTWSESEVLADMVEVQVSGDGDSIANIILNTHYFLRAPQTGDTGEASLKNYVPLVYPHPMVTAQDGGGDPPAAGTRVTISGNVTIGGRVTISGQ